LKSGRFLWPEQPHCLLPRPFFMQASFLLAG